MGTNKNTNKMQRTIALSAALTLSMAISLEKKKGGGRWSKFNEYRPFNGIKLDDDTTPMCVFNEADKNLSGDIDCWEIQDMWRTYFGKGKGWEWRAQKVCEGFDVTEMACSTAKSSLLSLSTGSRSQISQSQTKVHVVITSKNLTTTKTGFYKERRS